MNKEIKEILEKILLNCDTQEEKNKLLDYITNLQDTLKDREEYCYGLETQLTNLEEENKRLKEIIKDNTILVKDENENYQECNINPLDYKSRNEKAIEFCKKYDFILKWQLLEILQGEDKDE